MPVEETRLEDDLLQAAPGGRLRMVEASPASVAPSPSVPMEASHPPQAAAYYKTHPLYIPEQPATS